VRARKTQRLSRELVEVATTSSILRQMFLTLHYDSDALRSAW
jgi:hypothetical protein